MNSPASQDPEPDAEPAVAAHDNHPDPITGEPHAHPVGVGVGALSAGAAGAAIGAFAGPVGVVIGAAIGAIAGGLAGKEVAESPEISPTSEEGTTLDEFDQNTPGDVPLSGALAEQTSPHGDAFVTGGTLSGRDLEHPADKLDAFDQPHAAPAAAIPVRRNEPTGDRPLPTASSGLITPDEESFFADSATGESSILTEHPLPAAQAVSPGDRFAAGAAKPAVDDQTELEHAIRTGAYYRYISRQATGQAGSDFEDWIEAEKEVSER